MNNIEPIAIAFFTLTLSLSAIAGELVGKVTKVSDGDTICDCSGGRPHWGTKSVSTTSRGEESGTLKRILTAYELAYRALSGNRKFSNTKARYVGASLRG